MRDEAAPSPRVAGIVLAAGHSRRMGETNKLLAPVGSRPMVLWAVDALLSSRVDRVVVVTGHQADPVRAVVGARPVDIVHNERFAYGIGASVGAGVSALDAGVQGVVIALGDMPRVRADHVDRLLDAHSAARTETIFVPVFAGRRGNPVLWASRHFEALKALSGDVGGRKLLDANAGSVCTVEMPDSGVLYDIDTPEGLRAFPARRDQR